MSTVKHFLFKFWLSRVWRAMEANGMEVCLIWFMPFSPVTFLEITICKLLLVLFRVSKQNMLKTLNHFQPGNSEVKTFKILLYGSVGVGKSSFINSVSSSVQGRVSNRVPSNSVLAGESFTLEVKTLLYFYKLKCIIHCLNVLYLMEKTD